MDKSERRRLILAAALQVFSREGYAQARLDDVAREAGVAKGTLYLYFPDKQALFEAMVRDTVTPLFAEADAVVPHFSGTTRDLVDLLFDILVARILDGPVQAIVRLMISEGPRFPELAAFYHREVISRGFALIRHVMARGVARGEITSDAAQRFPQLVLAPALASVVWNSLFGGIEPLDTRGLMHAHRDVLLAGLGWNAP